MIIVVVILIRYVFSIFKTTIFEECEWEEFSFSEWQQNTAQALGTQSMVQKSLLFCHSTNFAKKTNQAPNHGNILSSIYFLCPLNCNSSCHLSMNPNALAFAT